MILILDRDPATCARQYEDGDVVELCSEYTATIQVAQVELGYNLPPMNGADPANVEWVAESIHHWNWLHDLVLVLNEEYKYRFEKSEDHRAFPTIVTTFEEVQACPGLYPNRGWTDPNKNIELSGDSVVQYCRSTYRYKADKLKYTKREPPWWLSTRS